MLVTFHKNIYIKSIIPCKSLKVVNSASKPLNLVIMQCFLKLLVFIVVLVAQQVKILVPPFPFYLNCMLNIFLLILQGLYGLSKEYNSFILVQGWPVEI